MNPLSNTSFYNIREKVGTEILRKYSEKREIVQKCVFLHYERLGVCPDDTGVMNVDVTCEGTWLTRGHKSHTSLVAVTDCETGFVLDFEVLPNFYLVCTQLENKVRLGKLTDEAYQKNKDKHAENCTFTFEGKSGGMEAQGAVTLWKRSIEKLKMRYVTFVGDGD